MQNYELWLGDCLDLLGQVHDAGVDLSIWSPPYHVGKEYEQGQTYDQWVDLLTGVIRQHGRIVRPGGFVAVNVADILCFPDPTLPRIQADVVSGKRSPVTREMVLQAQRDHPGANRRQLAALLGCSEQTVDRRINGNNVRGGKYATQTRVHLTGGLIEAAAQAAGLVLYDRRIWHKGPAWANSRWAQSSYRAVDEFEYIYLLWRPGPTRVDRGRLTRDEWATWGSRGVWFIPSVPANDDHPAMYPVELPRRLVRLLSDPGDLVLDPFMGSGTTGVAALLEGRRFLGIELDPRYYQMATNRLATVVAA